ncbi:MULTISPECIES: hypothetical protein [unclassified Streptomyces]|uniref:hypothetical protein n=1 Tax=unclassified Streptomyces TaxID=2593676 RepID=UPI00070BF08C|nr:hypothetical protein [Streptomyces sp. Root1310]KQX67584.1 hypothetical protein ASD48_16100 [Streptomyces sp. Root1310]
MAVQRPESPGGNGNPIPRDLPDQQADGGEDHWDVGTPGQAAGAGESGASGESGGDVENAQDVPDTDEAGTGRQGAPHAGSGQSDEPVPEEPAD